MQSLSPMHQGTRECTPQHNKELKLKDSRSTQMPPSPHTQPVHSMAAGLHRSNNDGNNTFGAIPGRRARRTSSTRGPWRTRGIHWWRCSARRRWPRRRSRAGVRTVSRSGPPGNRGRPRTGCTPCPCCPHTSLTAQTTTSPAVSASRTQRTVHTYAQTPRPTTTGR